MKRRNLFLSLICSILMAVALVTFTVISIVPKNGNSNNANNASQTGDNGSDSDDNLTINDDRDGSVDKPYILYDADSFMTYVVGKYKGEDGKYIDYTATSEDGELVYPELANGLNYELKNDINFAGSDFVTIFNEGVSFNGHIDGKGYSLKNISINVSKDNLDSFAKLNKENKFSANIAIFGRLDGAKIENIKVEDIKVAVADEVYTYVASGEFNKDYNATMKEITVGTLASLAYRTTIDEVAVSGTVDASAYAVYASNYVQGFNALGGVFGVADTCEISNLTTDVNISADNSKKFFVGGVAGYAYEVKLANANVKTNVLAHYEQSLYVGGVYGYALADSIDNTIVNLSVNEIAIERFNTKGVKTVNDTDFIWVAGLINRLEAKTAEDITTISNSKVIANVDIDGMYAGAVMDVFANETAVILNVKDVIVDSNVEVLKAYGFARTLNNAKIELTTSEIDEVNEIEFNIRLTGNVKLNPISTASEKLIVATIFSNFDTKDNVTVVGGTKALKPICSTSIYEKLEYRDKIVGSLYGNTENGTKSWVF